MADSSKYIPVLIELGSTRQVLRLLAYTLIALKTDVHVTPDFVKTAHLQTNPQRMICESSMAIYG